MTKQKLTEPKRTSLDAPCLCGHIRHLSTDDLTCCSQADCPCTVFKSISEFSEKERTRFLELGWIEDTTERTSSLGE